MGRSESIARKLLVIRDLVDDVLEELVPAAAIPTEQSDPLGCQHPANRREDLSTMGTAGERWRCKDCGYEHPPNTIGVVDGR